MVAFPGLCPHCLGDDNLRRPSQRFKQFLSHSTWTEHLDSHFSTRVANTRSCRHPRCRHRTTWKPSSEIRDHWTDVHRIPSTRKLTVKEQGTSMETSRGPGDAERRGLVDGDDADDCYVNYTETSFGHRHTKSPKIYLLEDTEATKATIGLGGAVQKSSQDTEFPCSDASSQPRISTTVDYSPVACSSVDLCIAHRDVDTQDGCSQSDQCRDEGDASRKRPMNEEMYDFDVEKQHSEEWEVQDIIDCKVDRRRGLLYRVMWVGDWDDTWEPSCLLNCPELVRAFHLAHPDKPRTASVVVRCKRERPNKSPRLR